MSLIIVLYYMISNLIRRLLQLLSNLPFYFSLQIRKNILNWLKFTPSLSIPVHTNAMQTKSTGLKKVDIPAIKLEFCSLN